MLNRLELAALDAQKQAIEAWCDRHEVVFLEEQVFPQWPSDSMQIELEEPLSAIDSYMAKAGPEACFCAALTDKSESITGYQFILLNARGDRYLTIGHDLRRVMHRMFEGGDSALSSAVRFLLDDTISLGDKHSQFTERQFREKARVHFHQRFHNATPIQSAAIDFWVVEEGFELIPLVRMAHQVDLRRRLPRVAADLMKLSGGLLRRSTVEQRCAIVTREVQNLDPMCYRGELLRLLTEEVERLVTADA